MANLFRGLGLLGAMVAVSALALGCGPQPRGHHVVYLNFSGQTLVSSRREAAAQGRTYLPPSVGPSVVVSAAISPFGSDAQDAADVQAELESVFYGYDVVFTLTRPAAGGGWDEVLFGGTAGLFGGAPGDVGSTWIDCGDASFDDVSLVYQADFASWADGTDPGARPGYVLGLALTAAHELGHSFGLLHVDNPADIMYPYLNQSTTWGLGRIVGGTTCLGPPVQDEPALLEKALGLCSSCSWSPLGSGAQPLGWGGGR